MRIRVMMVLAMCVAAAAMAEDKSELQKLDWMVGQWKGEAWVRMGPGEPQIIQQTENVQRRAGGEVLVIEGLGKDKDGKVSHEAMGLIFYDKARKEYRFIAAAAGRGVTETVMEVGEKTAVWRMTPPGGQVRYTLTFTDKGEWKEIGEFSRDSGATWMKFFEMTLAKVK